MIGAGKYDDCVTQVREKTNASAVILLVVNGNQGNGFSVQWIKEIPAKELANLLETVVIELRAYQE